MTGRQNRHPGKSNLPDADRQETPTLAMQSDRNRRRSKEKFARYLSPWYERAPCWIPTERIQRQPSSVVFSRRPNYRPIAVQT